MTTRLPEALPATSIGGGITDSLGYPDNINISLEDASSEAIIPILYPRSATVFAAICASIFTIVGIGGNLLTVVALLRCPKLRSHATTMFVISLAMSDLLFSTINLPLTASRYIHEDWKLGVPMCRLFPFFFYGNVAASLFSMVAITINRYILIGYYANYRKIYTKINIAIMIISVWFFSFGMMIPPLADVWGTLGLDKSTFSCTILRDSKGKSPKKFLMCFGFVMPCIVIIVCYSAIFAKVRQSRRNVQTHTTSENQAKHGNENISISNNIGNKPPVITTEGSQKSNYKNTNQQNSVNSQQRREDIRLTKMMLIIFVSFVVCFLPLMLVNVADDDVTYPYLHIIASILAWASAIINPFIYAFKNRQYQQAFVKILCFGKAGNNSSAVRSSMFGTKKQFKIFKGQTNTDADNKDSKQSTGGDKGVAICTPTSSKTFISDAMSQSNKKMNGNQTNVATTISPGTNMQMNLNDLNVGETGEQPMSKIMVNYIQRDNNMLNSNEV